LDARLLREIDNHGKQQFHTMLKRLLPQKMIAVCIEHTAIPFNKPLHQINAQERQKVIEFLKDFRMTITGALPIETGMVTAGGVSLKEVDPKTMQSSIQTGLFFAGEILDIDADTGGFNLQAAFSTGRMAGLHAAQCSRNLCRP